MGGGYEDESQPIMHPVRMELAPHARLGRRVNAIFAIMILLVFHSTLLVAGLLNWDVPCEFQLSRFLVIYGGVGLLFVYLLLREWLYYARLGSWPSTISFLLLCVFYAALCGAGVILTMYTIRSRVRRAHSHAALVGRPSAAAPESGLVPRFPRHLEC